MRIDNARNSIRETNLYISTFTEGFFREIFHTTEVLARNPSIIQAMASEEARNRALKLYEDYFHINDAIAYIYSGYTDGTLLINDYTPPADFDPRQRPWYTVALESKPYTSTGLPYTEAVTGEWLISQSRVLLDEEGVVQGVIAIDVSLDDLTELLAEQSVQESQQSFILDAKGEIIIHPRSDYLGMKIPWIKEATNPGQGSIDFTFEGRQMWAHYYTLPNQWTIVTTVERREIIVPIIIHLLLLIGAVLILARVLGLVQSRILSKRFAEPLMALEKRITAITQGKPRGSTPYRYSNHEIGKIADTIEQLAEHSLNRKVNELQAIIESTDNGILVVNETQDIIYMNSPFITMWPLSQTRPEAMKFLDILEWRQADIIDYPSFLADIKELMASDQQGVGMIAWKDDRFIEYYSRPLIENRVVVARLYSFRDITPQKQSEERLEILATTDALTGLWNRRFFMERAKEEIERARRYNTPLTFMMMDADDFKNINDENGHAAGDAVLQNLAQYLRSELRNVDLIGRLGGEEFGIALPETNLEQGMILAQRLQRGIEKNPTFYEGKALYCTMSIGISSYRAPMKHLDELLQEADKALYKAKAAGKNTVKKYTVDT